MIVYDMIWYN